MTPKEYNIHKLDSGLKVITCNMPGMESASVGVFAGIGGRFEEERTHGISHFVEHLLFKGTKKRSSAQISRAIEGVGGHINAYTSEEHTCYMIKVRGKHQHLAVDVLMDMVTDPLFDSGELEKERFVIKEEVHMILDHPGQYAGELVHELIWQGHPLGRMLIGTEETITAITRDDIRKFQETTYFPGNMLISAAGNIDEKALLRDAEKFVKRLKNYNMPRSTAFKSKQMEPRIKIINKPTEQIHVCIGMQAVPRQDPDRYTVKVLSTILGENMSSRLFQTIREKHGLSYDIHTGVSYFKDTGGFLVSSGIKPNTLRKFIDLVMKELKKVKENGVTIAELKRAKEFYEGQLTLGFEKTMTKMLWMGENIISTGRVPSVKEMLSNVEKVSVEDITRIADKIFDKNKVNIAIIGPVKENEKVEIDL